MSRSPVNRGGHGATRAGLLAVTLLSLLGGGGCASPGKLGEYEFRGRTVAMVAMEIPRPEIVTDEILDVDVRSPLLTALRVGADLVKEVEAARARPRLDSAVVQADVGSRMTHRLLRGISTQLRAIPTDDPLQADFEVELVVKRLGIDAEAWMGPAHFFVESEVTLREAATGRRIWRGKVTEREPIAPILLAESAPDASSSRVANDVLSAAALSALSSGEMVRMLEALADFAADRTLERFRRGLEAAKG
jgi:hypothetical protein